MSELEPFWSKKWLGRRPATTWRWAGMPTLPVQGRDALRTGVCRRGAAGPRLHGISGLYLLLYVVIPAFFRPSPHAAACA